eukprot:gene19813-23697_t
MGGNIEALENDDAGDFKIDLKYADPETGATWLMKACSYGAMKCAKALLEAGAEPNAEDSEGKVAMHYASKAYADDTTGDFKFEDIFEVLVKGGCVSLKDRQGRLPDVGEDAAAVVDKWAREGEIKGKPLQKERDEARKHERREASKAVFDKANDEYLSNLSACSINVCDTADTEGYKYGSRS